LQESDLNAKSDLRGKRLVLLKEHKYLELWRVRRLRTTATPEEL
jgi:hypothetical protein